MLNISSQTIETVKLVCQNLEKYATLDNFDWRQRPAIQGFTVVGVGSSRAVLKVKRMPLCVKIPTSPAGIAQNRHELHISRKHCDRQFFVKTIGVCNIGRIPVNIVEYAKPISRKKFNSLFNAYDTSVVDSAIEWLVPEKDCLGSQVPIDYDLAKLVSADTAQGKIFADLMDFAKEFPDEIVQHDLKFNTNWGIVSRENGDAMVLVDYGLTDAIWKKWYSLNDRNDCW